MGAETTSVERIYLLSPVTLTRDMHVVIVL